MIVINRAVIEEIVITSESANVRFDDCKISKVVFTDNEESEVEDNA